MPNKVYWVKFGSGDPRTYTGLSPTMVIFATQGGTALAGPGMSEVISGSGFYQFQYGPTISIIFLADGGSGLTAGDRYVSGPLDPIQAVDQTVGQPYASFGSTSVDPTTVIGWAKRNQEIMEGNAVFNKSTGVWDVYSRGSSTLIFEKQLANNTTQATKV